MATLPAASSSRFNPFASARLTELAPAAALILLMALQLHLVFTRSINWDEFHYFGQIANFAQGGQTKPLQTLHVHLFGWLLEFPGLGVDKIIAGRVVMFLCLAGTTAAITAIARKFVDRKTALLAAAAYLSAGYVMQHGWSFRTDPLAALLVTTSLAILARARLSAGWIVCFSTLLGTAGMITMKAILVAPAFAGIAWLRWSEAGYDKSMLVRLVTLPLGALVCFSVLYWLHSQSLPAASPNGVSYAASASRSMFFIGIPEYWNYARMAIMTMLPLILMIGLTARAAQPASAAQKVAIAGLLAPLLTVFFYHNTLPYYYPFILPSVAAGCAIALPLLTRRFGASLIAGVIALNGLLIWITDGESRLSQQRAIQQAAAEMFPEPVAYFDFPNFLPEMRKANSFLTHWGFESYGRGSGPSFRELMQEDTVPLLLTVDPTYDPTLLAAVEQSKKAQQFRPEDRAVLSATYRHFWGPFWLAGTKVDPAQTLTYSVEVPGPYTIGGSDLIIDGIKVPNGTIVELDRADIVLANNTSSAATITWGRNIKRPSTPAPDRPYWTDF